MNNLPYSTDTERQICTWGYLGNLRLWSVQELVSRQNFGSSKAYTMKQ